MARSWSPLSLLGDAAVVVGVGVFADRAGSPRCSRRWRGRSRPCRGTRCRGCCRPWRISDRAGSPRCSRRWRGRSRACCPRRCRGCCRPRRISDRAGSPRCSRRWRGRSRPCRLGDAAVVVGVGIFRIEPDRLAVVGDGAVEVALVCARRCRGCSRRWRISDRAGSPRCSRRWRGRGRPCCLRRCRGCCRQRAFFGSSRIASL